MFILGKAAQIPEGHENSPPMFHLYKRMFPVLLRLACDVDQASKFHFTASERDWFLMLKKPPKTFERISNDFGFHLWPYCLSHRKTYFFVCYIMEAIRGGK